MIVIKFKTWKDYKSQFLEWVKEPRRKKCKEYVRYYEQLSNQLFQKQLDKYCAWYGYKEKEREALLTAFEHCYKKARKGTEELIDSCQPKDLF